MSTFKAFRIHEIEKKIVGRFDDLTLDDLSAGEVVIRVSHSTINYKDAIAATGVAKILRRYPLVGGIDLAGTVESSTDPSFRKGDAVLVNGCDLSEQYDGGYAQYARVKAESVVPIPKSLDAFKAMAIGTAGYTAALAIHRMEQNGQLPSGGPVVVTGATGGVGSIAIDMLACRGYEVYALTGKSQAVDFLKSIGAAKVLLRGEVNFGSRPLEKAEYAGAIDNLGGETLTWLTRTMQYGANIASVGLASSPKLETTVIPFLLRAVNLLGINSVNTPRELRLAVWKRIEADLSPRHLDKIVTRTISLDELPSAFEAYIKAGVTGRTVVRID